MSGKPSISHLLAELGGSYASALGITLDERRPAEIHKWFLAAVLYGAPIPEAQATRTWREFERNDVLSPQRIIDTGWDGLVRILDAGGYARYDFKTATKLLDVEGRLLAEYGGDLNAVHAAATDSADLERRVTALGKGIGPVTVGIFLRELREHWKKAEPALSPLALAAAMELGFLKKETLPEAALRLLQRQWRRSGTPGHFSDFESALVRAGLRLRRGKPLAGIR